MSINDEEKTGKKLQKAATLESPVGLADTIAYCWRLCKAQSRQTGQWKQYILGTNVLKSQLFIF